VNTVLYRPRAGDEAEGDEDWIEAVEEEDSDDDDYVEESNEHVAATGPPRSPNWVLLFGVAERIADPTERERMLAIARKLTGAETRAAAEIMSVLCCWDWWCSST
jgi:hypothetical protein